MIFYLLAALLAGCTADAPVPEDTPQEIQFQVSTAAQTEATRATIVNNNTDLTVYAIRIDAYFNGTTTAYISNKRLIYNSFSVPGMWMFRNDANNDYTSYYWPIEGSVLTSSSISVSSLDFIGYVPYTRPSYIGDISYTVANGPSFTCTNLPVTSGGQPASLYEFMYAYLSNQTQATQTEAVGSKLPLQFQHPFAKISIQLKTSHRAIFNLRTIKFKNIKNNGTFTYANSPQWVTSGDNTDLTITLNDGISADADFTSAQITSMNLPLIVLPQSYTATDQIEIKLTWNNGDSESTYTFDNPVSSWESGKSYTYTLDLVGKIKFDVNIENWSVEETERNIRF